ncbi:hypothetical protein CVT24_003413 [Panaeolus cyanescens]|uniref:IPT/TIG domain-containing protein n=1 Tax=Panaeolus cyanescens TaxID=181874 RepID=A0A409Y6M9_9AGAR|nr:hypothetical protein CVT24_003413 [Panaeolus cyanescens]
MSTASTTTSDSRSPSPLTPEPSDNLDPVVIQSELDQTSSWYNNMHSPKSSIPQWGTDATMFTANHKSEEESMLRLDDLIEQHAYEDSPSVHANNNTLSYPYSSPPSYSNTASASPDHSINDFRSQNLLLPPRNPAIPITKPVPPPAALPRKPDPSNAGQRVVHPPKESCFNLPIMFPSIPEGGTKSRVETQVRVTVDLADASSSSDPYKYDRVGSWKWLKLPHGTATKKRTRKQGKIDPDPHDILHLSASVSCASPPHNRVLSCTSCQTREAKRVAKKLAARVRPVRSDSDSDGDGTGKPTKSKHQEDTTSIIQFNCAEILDFSTGSVVLPLRITCYCRHHREKVGFNVHFQMMDHTGRVVGSGVSRPIMITDDHKTSTANKSVDLLPSFTPPAESHDWSQISNDASFLVDSRSAPSKRKKNSVSIVTAKSRAKPYDASAKPNRFSREGSLSSIPSPSTTHSPLPTTRASTPSALQNAMISEPSQPPPLQHTTNSSGTSSPDTLATPLDHNSDVPMPEINFSIPEMHPPAPPTPISSPSHVQQQQQIPLPNGLMQPLQHSMPFMFFDPNQAAPSMQLQIPTIHRLIPNAGPTHGGIEVTVLGANFHPTIPLNCVFGETAASSTQRWSDNTLVCVLPPRAIPGVVEVWFEGFPKVDALASPPSLFTYADESDRALMELALQVVGLKMTGKIEDAKNVAMRIVGTAGSDGSESQNGGGNSSGMMQLASSPSMRDARTLLLTQGSDNSNFESRIISFLTVVDTPMDGAAPRSIPTGEALSHPSPSGQTLLHLSALLGFSSLMDFLIQHDADLDARDRNGFTPLHFAALAQSTQCASLLLQAGADMEVVNSLGKTPAEIAVPGFFKGMLSTSDHTESTDQSEDEDADLGDAEEEANDIDLRRILNRNRRAVSRRSSRLNLQSGRGTPLRSVGVSRAGTPPPPPDDKASKDDKSLQDSPTASDAKRAASFMEKMRTFAQFPQFPAPQLEGIIPNIPQLPLPGLPNLPAVPWGALPQMPMVFPVFVPMMPGWPSFLGGEHQAAGNDAKDGETPGDEHTRNMGAMAIRAAQEWRATWEKWVALAVATTARQQTEGEEMPPPEYTPRAPTTVEQAPDRSLESGTSAVSSARPQTADIRPVGYDRVEVPEQVVESFVYQPPAQTNQLQKKRKYDRMLLLFWLPILFLSMLWTFHTGVQYAFTAIKISFKAPLRT